jgi:class 3 adenylate cyclase
VLDERDHANRSTRLRPDELAVRVNSSVERITELTALGLLRPDAAGHELGDVHRVRLIEAFREAGVPQDVLVRAVGAGAITLAHYPDLHPPQGRPSERTYDEFQRAVDRADDLLPSLFGAFGLARPNADTHLGSAEEELLSRVLEIVAASEPDLILRAARIFGEGARRTTEAVVAIYDEAAQRMHDVPRVPVGPAYEQLVRPWAAFAQLAPVLAGWLTAEHLSVAIDAYSVGHTEQMLATAGHVPARQPAPPAIAFIDVSGFTRLAQERGDEEAAQVALDLGELSRAVAGKHGGRLVKLLGDGALIRFDDVASAVHACLELLTAMPRARLPPGHAGICAGPIVARDGDVFGRTVNLAARLSDLAAPGQIYMTEEDAVPLQGSRVVPRPLGPVELEGIGSLRIVAVSSEPTAM